MYQGQTIAVVVPCMNEELQIAKTLARMPAMADYIVVVDDASSDDTAGAVHEFATSDPRVSLIVHEVNKGVGGAISTGYVWARDEKIDITVVMAGDNQMDPDDFEDVIKPVANNIADYCKGNRFTYFGGLKKIPPTRKFGNFILSALTKITSGYSHVSDTQTGYTAINLKALKYIPVEEIYPRYGCPNDILAKLNIAEMRVIETPVNPLYHVGEQSKMKIFRVIGPILFLLMRNFFLRLYRRYIIADAHPLIFAYVIGMVCLFISGATCVLAVIMRFFTLGDWPPATLIMAGFFGMSAIQFLLAGMWMDFQANRHLCIRSSEVLPTNPPHTSRPSDGGESEPTSGASDSSAITSDS